MSDKNSNLVRQAAFVGGEIAPVAQSKTDSPAYQHGLRLALNLIPTLEGPILNRPGTRYCTPVLDSSYAPRLVPFNFADGQNFILEIGDRYVRILQAGAATGAAVTGTVPWLIADVLRLKFSQDGDVIEVTHPSYQPQEITRVSNLAWTVAPVSYTPQAFFGGNPRIANVPAMRNTVAGAGGLAAISAMSMVNNLWISSFPYSKGDFVLHLEVNDFGGHGAGYHLYQSTIDGNANSTPNYSSNPNWYDWTYQQSSPATYNTGNCAWNVVDQKMYVSQGDLNTANPPAAPWVAACDDTRPGKIKQYVVTQFWQDSLGRRRETLPSLPTQSLQLGTYTDRPTQIMWDEEAGVAGAPADYVILNYGVYEGRNGIFGFKALIPPHGTQVFSTYADDGEPPNYGKQPPRGTNPFDVALGAGLKTQSWPGANTNHEQRKVYGRSNLKPQDFNGSKLGEPKNFDINEPVQDTDAYNFKPASERLEEIRSLLSLQQLLIFTGAGAWGAEGANGAINPSSINLRRYSKQGASYLDPIAFEKAALFQTARGRIMDLLWDWRSKGYIARDVSVIARHLFENRNIVDWAYAEVPYSLVWAVRNDGVLLSLTYSSSGIEAWARHTTNGVFERVATIVETDATTGVSEDAVYVVVRRKVNGAAVRYIERFSTRVLPQKQIIADDLTSTFTNDVRLSNFLDCSLQYDGRSPTSSVTFSGASYAGGAQVTATAAANFIGSPVRGFHAGDVGASLVIDPDGLADGPIEATIVGVTSALVATVLLDADLPAAYQNTPVTGVAFASQTLTGLAHLEGMSVKALLDGAVAGPFVVTGGAITTGSPSVVAQVGLTYNSDFDLLDWAAARVKSNQKSVTKAIFEVVTSRGIQAGEDFDHLKTAQLQVVEDGNTVPGLTTGIVEVTLGSSWNTGARACMRQSDPLPLTITAVTREIVLGGR